MERPSNRKRPPPPSPDRERIADAAAAQVVGKVVRAFTYTAVVEGVRRGSDVDVSRLSRTCTCSRCGRCFASPANLRRHMHTHLSAALAIQCRQCDKAYVSPSALKMHEQTHKLRHPCGVCGKLFSRQWLLQEHLRLHTGERPYGCAHCGKTYSCRSNLRWHVTRHHAQGQAQAQAAPLQCRLCWKYFSLQGYLDKHVLSCGQDRASEEGASDCEGEALSLR